ncbi:hypothetical protein BKA70DRAFT_1234841 [Coprinopsis sp. MPI-PUGE-AT-0042]|nr:hypothetical protein BKA70DRAFT_1234841 [Coprinopsis sp. MPI-PUGE-AT-0042]
MKFKTQASSSPRKLFPVAHIGMRAKPRLDLERTTRSMTLQARQGDRRCSSSLTLTQNQPTAARSGSPSPADGFFDGVNGYALTEASKAQKKYLKSLQSTVPLPAPPLTSNAVPPPPPPPVIDFEATSSSKDVALAYLTLALPMARDALGLSSTRETWQILFPKDLREADEHERDYTRCLDR